MERKERKAGRQGRKERRVGNGRRCGEEEKEEEEGGKDGGGKCLSCNVVYICDLELLCVCVCVCVCVVVSCWPIIIAWPCLQYSVDDNARVGRHKGRQA